MSSSVIIPIAFWNTSKPVFRISTISVTPNFKKLVTGSYSGQLCLWDIDFQEKRISPRNVLIGHNDSVTCLASTNEYVISCCEGKMLCRWDLDDGYCSKVNRTVFIHKKMQLFVKSGTNEEFLFSCGNYSDIFVIHPFTLQIIFIFSSKSNSMWISNFQVIQSQGSQIITGITTNGCLKLWTFDDFTSEVQFETQSYILPIINVVDLKYNSSLSQILIVSETYWVLYDSEFSSCIYKVENYNEETLSGGNFCDDNVIIWTNFGKLYLYKIIKTEYKLISVFLDSINKYRIFEPALNFEEKNSEKYLIKGDSQGKISFWKLDLVQNNLHLMFSSTLKDNWVTNDSGFFDSVVNSSTVTCCIYVLEFDKFFVGCFNGSIVSITATESLMSFYYHSIKNPSMCTFVGHNGKINCLLYPHEKHSYYNKSHLVSGGSDFSVCLWDIVKEVLLYKFCVQGGEILRLIVPPKDCNTSVKLSICSVSSDHSVAVLNLKEQRCLILTSRHKFPVVMVHWKPLDDFIIIECFDGTIFVWQIETGHLDRVLNGVLAQEVIYACSNQNCDPPALNFYIHEQNEKGKSMKRKIFNMLESSKSSPFEMNTFLTNEISESHVFSCNLESTVAQFNDNFESEALECAIISNTYFLTKSLKNDSLKKPNAVMEKTKKLETDGFQNKHDNMIKENVKFGLENDIATKDSLKSSLPSKNVLNLIKFFLSSIHYWGADPGLDKFISSKLGIEKSTKAICFGILSQPGIYSLFLPTAESFCRRSSSLFASICIAMTALSKIVFFEEYFTQVPTVFKKNCQKNVFSLYEMNELTYFNFNEESFVPTPNIELLAKPWQSECSFLRKIVRKLLCNYLQSLDSEKNAHLLEFWHKYLPHFKILDKTLPENVDFENIELKTVALVLFGVIGADHKFKSSDSVNQENYVYQTCASFVYLLLLPNAQKLQFSTLQTLAIEFIGRGYIVWEQFLKIEKIIPILFEVCANLANEKSKNSDSSISVNKYFTVRKALKSIAIARTAAFINCLKNEIAQIKSGQNHNFLSHCSKGEVLYILSFLLEKTPYIMLLYLNDVVSILVHCIDFSHLRQENLTTLIPVMQKFRQVHHSVISQKIAVGLATGSVVIHDLKTGKVHEISAHKDSVSALKFSEDGKLLVSYSCYENRLSFWQVLTGIFGLGHVHIKCIKSCQTYQIHDEEIRNHLEIATLTWTDKKSVILSLCDGTEDIFHS